MQMKSK